MKYLNKIIRDRLFLISLVVTCIMGIIAHGIAIFNNLVWHDALGNQFGYDLSGSYTSGRWAAELLELFSKKFFGTYNYSVPGYIFFISMLFTALISYLIVRILKINDGIIVGLISSIAIVFPSITTHIAYFYSMPFTQFAYLLCAISVLMYFEKATKIKIILGIILLPLR